MNLKNVCKNFLLQENLENQKLLLMVSGGVDSVVLAEIIRQIHNPQLLHIFHLDHGFRDTSKDDADFVQQYAEKNNISCTIKKLKSTPDKNIEANWRKERQQLSQACADTHGCDRILTAHHATDLVETMIFRITKGCGPQGLSPFDLSTKPFASAPKSDILEYAKKQNLSWREDTTNQDTTFQRNRIRQEVLPVLRSINPNLEKTFWNEQELFRSLAEFSEQETDRLTTQKQMPLEDFLTLPPYLQQSLIHALGAGSAKEVQDCLQWLNHNPEGGTEKNIGGNVLRLKKGVLEWK